MWKTFPRTAETVSRLLVVDFNTCPGRAPRATASTSVHSTPVGTSHMHAWSIIHHASTYMHDATTINHAPCIMLMERAECLCSLVRSRPVRSLDPHSTAVQPDNSMHGASTSNEPPFNRWLRSLSHDFNGATTRCSRSASARWDALVPTRPRRHCSCPAQGPRRWAAIEPSSCALRRLLGAACSAAAAPAVCAAEHFDRLRMREHFEGSTLPRRLSEHPASVQQTLATSTRTGAQRYVAMGPHSTLRRGRVLGRRLRGR